MLTVDCETCGLCGPTVLIQYQRDNGPIVLHNVWNRPVKATMELIEEIAQEEILGFNLVFDIFQTLQLLHHIILLHQYIYHLRNLFHKQIILILQQVLV